MFFFSFSDWFVFDGFVVSFKVRQWEKQSQESWLIPKRKIASLLRPLNFILVSWTTTHKKISVSVVPSSCLISLVLRWSFVCSETPNTSKRYISLRRSYHCCFIPIKFVFFNVSIVFLSLDVMIQCFQNRILFVYIDSVHSVKTFLLRYVYSLSFYCFKGCNLWHHFYLNYELLCWIVIFISSVFIERC